MHTRIKYWHIKLSVFKHHHQRCEKHTYVSPLSLNTLLINAISLFFLCEVTVVHKTEEIKINNSSNCTIHNIFYPLYSQYLQ